jgi:hypothetical protein
MVFLYLIESVLPQAAFLNRTCKEAQPERLLPSALPSSLTAPQFEC